MSWILVIHRYFPITNSQETEDFRCKKIPEIDWLIHLLSNSHLDLSLSVQKPEQLLGGQFHRFDKIVKTHRDLPDHLGKNP